MNQEKQKKTPNKKYTALMLEEAIREKVEKYCENHGLNMSQFIRTAIVEKLTRPVTIPTAEPQPVDLSTLELAIQQLTDQQNRVTKSLDYLIERNTLRSSLDDDKINEAKVILLEEQPETYDEANKKIKDINIMTEAMNQLLTEKEVEYKQRRFKWK